MSNITLVAIDLDGTLLTSKGNLSTRNKEAIKACREQGIYIILATMRNPEQVVAYSRQLGLLDPMICTNGAQVWASPDGPVWACHTIAQSVALAIAEFADQYGWELSTTVGEMTYWKQRQGQPLGLVMPNVTVVERNTDAIINTPIRILVHDKPAIPAIQTLCKDQFHEECWIETFHTPDGELQSIAILAPNATKRHGLELVLNHLGISPDRVMAIGDNLNDLAMLDYVGFPVAVGNAVEAVKQIARVVTPDNDSDGVAWVLETYPLS